MIINPEKIKNNYAIVLRYNQCIFVMSITTTSSLNHNGTSVLKKYSRKGMAIRPL